MTTEQAEQDSSPRPIVPFLKLEPRPHLVARRCRCGAVYLDVRRVACGRCGAAGSFEMIELSGHGRVWVFSVVHQSFPGIETPYVTAIVDLPEGVSVRANLVGVSPETAEREPQELFGMAVEMVTRVVAKDREGHDVVAFAFHPVAS